MFPRYQWEAHEGVGSARGEESIKLRFGLGGRYVVVADAPSSLKHTLVGQRLSAAIKVHGQVELKSKGLSALFFFASIHS